MDADIVTDDAQFIPLWEGFLLALRRVEALSDALEHERCGIPRPGYYSEIPDDMTQATGPTMIQLAQPDFDLGEVAYIRSIPDHETLQALETDAASHMAKMSKAELRVLFCHRKFVGILSLGEVRATGKHWFIPDDGGDPVERVEKEIPASFWSKDCLVDYRLGEAEGNASLEIPDRFGRVLSGHLAITAIRVSAKDLMARLWKVQPVEGASIPISFFEDEGGAWLIEVTDNGLKLSVRLDGSKRKPVRLGLRILRLMAAHRAKPVCRLLLDGLEGREHDRTGGNVEHDLDYENWEALRQSGDPIGQGLLATGLKIEDAHAQLTALIQDHGPRTCHAPGPYDVESKWTAAVGKWPPYRHVADVVRKSLNEALSEIACQPGDGERIRSCIVDCLDFPALCIVLHHTPPTKRQGRKLNVRAATRRTVPVENSP